MAGGSSHSGATCEVYPAIGHIAEMSKASVIGHQQ